MARAIQTQESEQLLFSFEELFPMVDTQMSGSPIKANGISDAKAVSNTAHTTLCPNMVKPTNPILRPSSKPTKHDIKPAKPAFLATMNSNKDSLEGFMLSINANGIYLNDAWRSPYLNISVNRVSNNANRLDKALRLSKVKERFGSNQSNCFTAILVYIDSNLNLWKSELTLTFDRDPQILRYSLESGQTAYCNDYSVGEWTLQKSQKLIPKLHFIQSESELMYILTQHHPYTAEWAKQKGFDVRTCLLAPHIEILSKAGYAFADTFAQYERLKEDACTIFNRLCQAGTKPKDIFKTCKMVYNVLKDETNLEIWDCYRKLQKLGKIGVDSIQQAYDQGYDRKDLEYFNSILAKRYNDKPVFTWNSLMQYLVRLDTFEAISRHEAFVLLNDYLSMCNQLHMEPRIDGDSLKREHDIAARNCRNRRDEIMAERMHAGCERMRKYDYAEGIYFVRGIRGYEDLLDEANQQHNCVASYASNIANGTSYIYVMRHVANPDKSLITIELSPNGKSIRQKYLAYNQPIHNKSQSEFIERWMKHNKEIE